MKPIFFPGILQFLLVFSCISAIAASQNFDFAKARGEWGGKWTLDLTAGKKTTPALKVVDDSTKGGVYAISKPFALRPDCDYELTGLCKTDGKVTSQAVMFMSFYDAAGKRLKSFSSTGAKAPEWTKLRCIIPAASIPAETASYRIILQPARGAAQETGAAWFDDVSLNFGKPLAPRPGKIEISKKMFIKELPSELPVNFKTAPTSGKSRMLELSWRNFRKISALVLKFKNDDDAKPFRLSYWNDRTRQWISAGDFSPRQIPDSFYWEVVADKLPETRKLLLEFNNTPEISDLKLYTTPEITENWQASWIWFTKQRVEHLNRYFRKTFTVKGDIDRAFFQGTGDDCAVFYLNGQRLISNSAWNQPVRCEITGKLVQGENIITAAIKQDRYAAGVLAEIDVNYQSGDSQKIITDETWKSTGKQQPGWSKVQFDDSQWTKSVCIGVPPDGVWGPVPYKICSPRRQILLKNNPLPAKLTTGKTTEFAFELEIPAKVDKQLPVYFRVVRNGHLFINDKLGTLADALKGHSRKTAIVKVKFFANRALYPGDYTFSLHIPYCKVMKDNKEWQPVVSIANDYKPHPLTAELKKLHGIPTLHLNNKPYWSMFYTSNAAYDMETANNQAFAGAGIKMVHCYASPTSPAEGKFDFTDIDRMAYEICRNNPDALIVMKPSLRKAALTWFLKKYPAEAAVLDAGRKLSSPSLASEKWRQVAGEMLREMIRHINSGPYADRVIGYFFREGEEGQWMHYWGGSDPGQKNTLSDYSQPMQNYFKNWLRKKYGSDADLQKAWQDQRVTFESAEIPGRQERIAASGGVFRDPAKNRRAIDYAEALSDVICDGINYYGKIVKEETGNKRLSMAFYGHIIDLGAHFLGEQVGYLKQRAAINSPYIDYFAGPISYARNFRDIGGTGSFDYPAPACLRLQNKLWLNEDDTRTHLTNPPGYAYSVRAPRQTDEVMAREFAKALCAGAGLYWLNLSSGNRYWYDDLHSLQTIGRLNQIGQKAVKGNLGSVSEVAMVMSDRSLLYLRQLKPRGKNDTVMERAILCQREAIARLGAPFDEYLVDDFLNSAMPDYKLYIFLNAWYLTGPERQAIQRKLTKNHAAALWVYAPGYISGEGISLTAMEELTGIAIASSSTSSPVDIKIPDNNPLLPGQSATFGMPKGVTLKPVFFSSDKTAQVIGTLQNSKQPGFVMKKANGYTSYFCTIPALPAPWLRRIAEKAGVHIYSRNDDAVYACHDYLAIHTSSRPGLRTLTLPGNATVRRLYPASNDKPQIKNRIIFSSAKPQTLIFRIDNSKKTGMNPEKIQ